MGLLAETAEACAGGGRFLFPDGALDFGEAQAVKRLLVKGQDPGQEFVEQHAQGVDIRTCVNVLGGKVHLFRAHVLGCAQQLPLQGKYGLFGEGTGSGLGNAKVNELGHGPVPVHGYQDIGGLDVPMDDTLLVGIVQALADLSEELEALFNAELAVVSVARDGHASDEFHSKVRPPGLSGAGIEYMGDIGMLQQGQGLTFGVEAGDHLLGVHARLDDLQGHLAFDRLFLLGQIDQAHTTLANLLEKFVMADLCAWAFHGG